MKRPDATFLLQERILLKEIECSAEKILMQERFKTVKENMKPINLLKHALSSSALPGNLLDASIGMATGFLAKKLLVRSSHNPMLKLAGAILQISVTSLTVKNSDVIKSIGELILKKIFPKKEVEIQKE
jgi:hypothetical protein